MTTTVQRGDPIVFLLGLLCFLGIAALLLCFVLPVSSSPRLPVSESQRLDSLPAIPIVTNRALSVNAAGAAVQVTDGNTYTSGAGGTVQVSDVGLIHISAGGGADNFSNNGVLNAGQGGDVSLSGSLRLASDGYINIAPGSTYNGGSTPGTDGYLTSDGCDLRGTIYTGSGASITFGRTSYTSGAVTPTDKGGNAVW